MDTEVLLWEKKKQVEECRIKMCMNSLIHSMWCREKVPGPPMFMENAGWKPTQYLSGGIKR